MVQEQVLEVQVVQEQDLEAQVTMAIWRNVHALRSQVPLEIAHPDPAKALVVQDKDLEVQDKDLEVQDKGQEVQDKGQEVQDKDLEDQVLVKGQEEQDQMEVEQLLFQVGHFKNTLDMVPS